MGAPAEIFIIAAVADNGVIGTGGALPWRLGSDLKRFKRLTLGKPVVMGRKTFESIGRALPGRINIVVSRSGGVDTEDVTVANSLEQAIAIASEAAAGALEPGTSREIAVIGGGEIYAQAMPIAGRLEITRVHATPRGDTLFPPIDPAVWTIVASEDRPAGERDEHPFTFATYRRRPSAAGGLTGSARGTARG